MFVSKYDAAHTGHGYTLSTVKEAGKVKDTQHRDEKNVNLNSVISMRHSKEEDEHILFSVASSLLPCPALAAPQAWHAPFQPLRSIVPE